MATTILNRRSFLKFLLAIPGLAWLGSKEQFTDDYLTDGNNWFLMANNQDPPVTWNQLGNFVSPITGSDILGDGSYERPFRTINKAMDVLKNGDTIFIAGI